jgi:hypothetical protein
MNPNNRRDGSMTAQNDVTVTPDGPQARRFSEGIERTPLAPLSSRVGGFGDGIERAPTSASATRVGSFADGLAQTPNVRSARRVGSFGDGFEQAGGSRATVRHIESRRGEAESRIAA